MKIRPIAQSVLEAIVSLLRISCPELTAEILVAALRSYEANEQKPTDDRLIPLPQIARKLGIHAGTARRWAREGRLATVRIGGRHMMRALDLAELMGTGEEVQDG